jgi:hypothetical protein
MQRISKPPPKERPATAQGPRPGSAQIRITPRRSSWPSGAGVALLVMIFAAHSLATATLSIVLTGRICAVGITDSKLTQSGHDLCPGISGATVATRPALAISDKNGNFRLQLSEGDYKLLVSADGYAPITLPITVSSDTELTIELTPMATTTVVANIGQAGSGVSSTFYSADELPAGNPDGLAHRSRYRAFQPRQLQVESKRRSILLPALRETTVSPSRSTFALAILWCLTIFPPMLMVTDMPIPIF